MLGVRPRTAEDFNEAALLKEINDLTEKMSQVPQHFLQTEKGRFFFKWGTIKIGQNYFKLANHHFELGDVDGRAVKFWKKGLNSLRIHSDIACDKPEINYEHWFTISTFYARRIQLHQNGHEISFNKKVKYLNKGLEAINHALSVEQRTQALFQKFLFLQMLAEVGCQPPESPIDCLRLYLDNHPNPNSDDYMQYAQIYGGELAKTGQLELARNWFLNLTKQKLNAGVLGMHFFQEYLDKKSIAKNLWKDQKCLISDEMEAKVNKAYSYLRNIGFMLRGIEADGNCFFNAFLKSYESLRRKIPLLDQQKDKVSFLREQVAAQYRNSPSNAINPTRAEEIKKNTEWVVASGEGDLLSKVLSIPVRILTAGTDDVSDVVSFIESDKPNQDWNTLSESDKPSEFIFIVDLGGHFIFASSSASLQNAAEQNDEEFLTRKSNAINYLYLGKILDQIGDKINALVNFEKAAELDPQNLEIQIWLNSQKVKNMISELQLTAEVPKEDRLQEIVDIFNQFCSIFNSVPDRATEQTSTFIPIAVLANHFYFSLLPTMANILARLQQFRFALDLYQRVFDAFDTFKQEKILNESDEPSLHVAIGTLHFFNKDFSEAENYLNEAIRLDPRCAMAYQNLVGVYSDQKDQGKLSHLWSELNKVLVSVGFHDQPEELSAILFNFGTAYAILGFDWLQKAEEFYRKSLQYDPANMDSLLYLSRVLIVKKEYSEATVLLDRYLEQRNSSPFEESSGRDFQVYFCFACVLALSNQLDRAGQMACEAGKTHFDEDKAQSLQRYLYALKTPIANTVDGIKKEIEDALFEAVRKIQFESRIGKLINKEAINISKDNFIGYHGTADFYTETLLQEIKPIRAPSRQFRGEGFYIAEDRDMASYFAMKKVKEEGKGKPVLLKVYASQSIVGQKVPGKYKIKSAIQTTYDFIKAPIGDFESYSQYYVFENNLRKLQIRRDEDPENVEWDDQKYNDFQKRNRQFCI